MKKLLLAFSLFIFLISCGKADKKEKGQNEQQEQQEEDFDINQLTEGEDLDSIKKENIQDSILKKHNPILDPTKGVLVVFKKNINIVETEKMIEDKGLKLDKDWITDKNSLKIGIINVPAAEKEEWLSQLIDSGRFRDVKLYSEENLKKLMKDRESFKNK